MTDYTELDGAIVAHIAASRITPTASSTLRGAACDALGITAFDALHSDADWRLIGRRLQALRKSGRIKFDHSAAVGRGKWHVVESKP